MEITLNGAPYALEDAATVAELLRELDLAVERVAVAVNREVVPRAGHAGRRLAAGDEVEIIQAVAGG